MIPRVILIELGNGLACLDTSDSTYIPTLLHTHTYVYNSLYKIHQNK